jgi:NAD(P)-dependent dehydrogenase (short-subunit alcohol dehydrogenase family)
LIIQERHLNVYNDISNTEYLRATRFYQPGGEVGTEKDVAEAVFWICSDKSKYINGATLKIDGGAALQEQFELIKELSKEISKNK